MYLNSRHQATRGRVGPQATSLSSTHIDALYVMGFYGINSYDFADPTMSQQNCFRICTRAYERPQPLRGTWNFRRWTNFTRGTNSRAQGQCPKSGRHHKLEEIRSVRRSHTTLPGKSNTYRPQATGYRRQASSYKLFKKIFHLIPSSD